jgi:hypothetical protein
MINLTPADAQRLEHTIRRQAKAAQKRWYAQQSDDEWRVNPNIQGREHLRCPGCATFAAVHPCFPNCGAA